MDRTNGSLLNTACAVIGMLIFVVLIGMVLGQAVLSSQPIQSLLRVLGY